MSNSNKPVPKRWVGGSKHGGIDAPDTLAMFDALNELLLMIRRQNRQHKLKEQHDS